MFDLTDQIVNIGPLFCLTNIVCHFPPLFRNACGLATRRQRFIR